MNKIKSINNEDYILDISNALKYHMDLIDKDFSDINIVCIGTDKSISDSVGPFIGSFLDKEFNNIYGTLKEPIHAMNIYDRLEEIDLENNLIIAIDACLSNDIDDLYNITIENVPIKPGLGVGKTLPPVGDISIKVNIGKELDSIFESKNNRIYDIIETARKV